MIRRFARPYARALMDVVGSPDKARSIRDELARFDEVRKASPELQELYANPGIELEQKFKITQTIAERLRLSELSVRLLDLVVRNRRMKDLDSIIEALAEMVRQATNTVAADVRAAQQLTDQERAELRRTLEKKAGRNVELMLSTDADLIAGFVARIGSEVYDASVSRMIQRFRESLE